MGSRLHAETGFSKKFMLSGKQIVWRRKRRVGMNAAGITPKACQLTKISKMQSAGCRLCRIARKARGESTDIMAFETCGQIKSAGCKGMTTTVTAAAVATERVL